MPLQTFLAASLRFTSHQNLRERAPMCTSSVHPRKEDLSYMTRYLLVFVVALGGMVGDVPAQVLNDLKGSAGAFFTFADPTDIKIEIKVWGAVKRKT